MAAPAAVLSILVDANTGGATRGLIRVNQRLDDTEKHVGKTTAALKTMAKAGVALGAAGLIVGAKKSIEAATDLNEQINKTRVVFRGSEGDILRWSKSTAFALGISRREALEATGVFGNMLVPMGFARDRAGEMSVRMVKLAADMASFNNATPKETLDALRSGLAGETEPLRRFGVFLNDARLKQEALNLHLKNAIGPNGALTANAKAQATYSVILKDTKDAQGDFARTSGSLANQQRILRAQVENLAAKVGQLLIPAVTGAVRWLTRFVHQMETGRGAGGRFAAQLKDLGQAFRDIWPLVRTAAQAMGAFAGVTNTVAGVRLPAFIQVLLRLANPITRTIDFIRLVSAVLKISIRLWSQTISVVRSVASVVGDRLAPAFDALKTAVNLALAPLRRAYNLLKGIASIAGGVVGKLGDLGSSINPFGSGQPLEEFFGQFAPFAPFTGRLGSKGARSVDAFTPLAGRFGLSMTSGFRPGDDGWHGVNRARDYGGSAGSMIRFAQFMAQTFGGKLLELIHTPLGFGVKNGQRVPLSFWGSAVNADHFDHVHVAMAKGGTAHKKVRALVGEQGPEIVDLPVGAKVHSFSKSKQMVRSGLFPGFAKGGSVGRFEATSYGPPWGGIQGTGVTATGVNLKGSPHLHGIAVDPSVLKLGRKYWAWPNPFGYRGPFKAFDTGGAIKGNRIDFYDWRGRSAQLGWGRKGVTLYSSDPFKGARRASGDALLRNGVLSDRRGRRRGVLDRISPVQREMLNGVPAPRPVINVGQPLKGEAGDTSVEDPLLDVINQQIAATEAHTQALVDLRTQQARNEALIRTQGPTLTAALVQMVNGGIGGNAGLGRQFPSSIGLGGLARV